MTTKENPSMDLDELERLLAEATPGPWRWSEAYEPDDYSLPTLLGADTQDEWSDREHPPVLEVGGYECDIEWRNKKADSALIVSAVNSLPALIAAARRAEELAGAVRANVVAGVRLNNGTITDDEYDATTKAMLNALQAYDRTTLAEGAPR